MWHQKGTTEKPVVAIQADEKKVFSGFEPFMRRGTQRCPPSTPFISSLTGRRENSMWDRLMEKLDCWGGGPAMWIPCTAIIS